MRGFGLLLIVWSILLALLGLTIGASFLLTGPASLVTGLTVALAKAGLIFWFFMQLRREGVIIRMMALGGVVWLTILFLLLFADYATRGVLA